MGGPIIPDLSVNHDGEETGRLVTALYALPPAQLYVNAD